VPVRVTFSQIHSIVRVLVRDQLMADLLEDAVVQDPLQCVKELNAKHRLLGKKPGPVDESFSSYTFAVVTRKMQSFVMQPAPAIYQLWRFAVSAPRNLGS
jgi:hypothetical protein